ncbi:trimeric intracellular cation channel family protein [Flavobacteriaceae bacterium R38]|nr:trimeric intracellular cation channel family protein [Flavobacteriaceae bacterium R38]
MVFYSLDIIGTFAFAISGFLTAFHKRLDLFGLFIIAFVTALGGGTLRDVLIGRTPVGWMIDLNYVYVVFGGVVFAILFKRKLEYLRTSLFLFDTIGLAVFTILGIEKGIDANLHPVISIALGTMSASFGGVIRDILCNEIPIIFEKKEIYATACVFGGAVFFVLKMFTIPMIVIYIITISIIITIRLLAVKYKLKLPQIKD